MVLLAIALWVPAGVSNAYFKNCELQHASDVRKQAREMMALADAAKVRREQTTFTSQFYGTRENFENLRAAAINPRLHFIQARDEIGGQQFQLQIHECPVGANYTGDTVYSGSLTTWDQENQSFTTVAELHSLGALNASGYTLYKAQAATIIKALDSLVNECRDISTASNAQTFRALLQACNMDSSEATQSALIRAVLQRMHVGVTNRGNDSGDL